MTKILKITRQYLVCLFLLVIIFSPLVTMAECIDIGNGTWRDSKSQTPCPAPSAPTATGAMTGITKGISDFNTTAGLPTGNLIAVITGIVKSLLALMGLVLVILILYAGFTWMTAQGDEKKVDTAKAIIKNATIGVILIIISYALATFIITEVTGAITGSGSSNTPTVK